MAPPEIFTRSTGTACGTSHRGENHLLTALLATASLLMLVATIERVTKATMSQSPDIRLTDVSIGQLLSELKDGRITSQQLVQVRFIMCFERRPL